MVLVCLHIYEPPLILIHIDELQPHFFFYKNPFIVHFSVNVRFGHVFCLSCLP